METLCGTWWGISTTSPERVKTYFVDGGGYVARLNDGTEFGPYVREIDSVRAARATLRAGA